MDHASVDGRRRLVLVRRDNVEHLIMIGGPVDVVVETGIGESQQARVRPARGRRGAGFQPRAPQLLGRRSARKVAR